LFYIKLLDREEGELQPIAVGIDPGSKKEAFTVKSAAHTYLNIQADAVTWVKEHVETRRNMRRARRYRKTPYRKNRSNRNINKTWMSPSTRARWGWKLRLCKWLARYYPVDSFAVEDIAAKTYKGKGGRWNLWFSPLQVGKEWFYDELNKIAPVKPIPGHETKLERDRLGLTKISNKMSEKFEAHCVDSWTLANSVVGGHTQPDNKQMLYIVPLRFHRRQLHRLQPEKGGVRKPYGGTLSFGMKRGSWVTHPKYGLCYLGGQTGKVISLHSQRTGERLTKVNPRSISFVCHSSWRLRTGEGEGSPALRAASSPLPDK
jgi:hypothetical protein